MRNDHALLIGGTGMLRGVGQGLVRRGWRVVTVSRHPQRGVHDESDNQQFLPVAADWRSPASLVDAALVATGGYQAQLAVVWVHSPHRAPVSKELERAIAPGGVVVQVWGSADQDPRDVMRDELVSLPDRQICHVILGYISELEGPRWLTHSEISHGVLQALDRPGTSHLIGVIDPWNRRP